jgi:hypothetical protein
VHGHAKPALEQVRHDLWGGVVVHWHQPARWEKISKPSTRTCQFQCPPVGFAHLTNLLHRFEEFDGRLHFDQSCL